LIQCAERARVDDVVGDGRPNAGERLQFRFAGGVDVDLLGFLVARSGFGGSRLVRDVFVVGDSLLRESRNVQRDGRGQSENPTEFNFAFHMIFSSSP
jgi:hypothetical protein